MFFLSSCETILLFGGIVIFLNLSLPRFITILSLIFSCWLAVAADEEIEHSRWSGGGDASFFIEGNQRPTSRQGRYMFDFGRFELWGNLKLPTGFQVHGDLEVKRRTTSLNGTNTTVTETRVKSLYLRREIDFLPKTEFQMGLIPYVFEKSDRSWLHSRWSNLVNLYRLFPEQDLGVGFAYEERRIPLRILLNATNGEGSAEESGLSKSFGLLVEWGVEIYVRAGYLRTADENFGSTESVVERIYGNIGWSSELFSVDLEYYGTQEPSDRITSRQSFDDADLTRRSGMTAYGDVSRLELGLPFFYSIKILLARDLVRPIRQERAFDSEQTLFALERQFESGQTVSLFYYRREDQEWHSLRSQEADGYGFTYRWVFDL